MKYFTGYSARGDAVKWRIRLFQKNSHQIFLSLSFIFLAGVFCVFPAPPILAQSSEGGAPLATSSLIQNKETATTTSKTTTGSPEIITPSATYESAPANPQTTVPASPLPESPRPAAAITSSPALTQATSTITPIPEPRADAPDKDGSDSLGIFTLILLGACAIILGSYMAVYSKLKSKAAEEPQSEKDDTSCRTIKNLLDQKRRELEAMARSWPKEKILNAVKEKVLSENQREFLRQAEVAKEKYEQLEKAIAILQGEYDLCLLEIHSKENIVLDKAMPEAIDSLIAIEKSLIGSKIYSPMTSRSEWLEEFKNGVIIYLIKKGDEILGNITYEKRSGGVIYLSGLAIKKDFQGRGVGRIVVQKIMEEFKNAAAIELVTHPENTAAIRLYKAFGFKIESLKENYFGDGEPRLLLIKKISR